MVYNSYILFHNQKKNHQSIDHVGGMPFKLISAYTSSSILHCFLCLRLLGSAIRGVIHGSGLDSMSQLLSLLTRRR